MTDSSPRDLDQLASDLVDGLLPPTEAARAQRDPEIAARVARIEQLRSTLRSVPPAEPSHMSRAIGAAVAAAQVDTTAPARVALHAVTPSGSAVPRPARGTPRPWLAAAAALLVAGVVTAGLVAGLSSGGDDSSNDSAVMADNSPDEPAAGEAHDTDDSASAFDENQETDEAGGESPYTAAAVELGAVANSDELVALVAQRVTDVTPSSRAPTAGVDTEGSMEEGPSNSTSSAPDGACPGLTEAGDPGRGTLVYVANATLDGSPVRVHVYEQGDDSRLVATDQLCADIVDVPFGS